MIQPSTRHTHLFPLYPLIQGSHMVKETEVHALPSTVSRDHAEAPTTQHTRPCRCVSRWYNFGKKKKKKSYLPSQQLVMHTWRWEAAQVLSRLREKSGGFQDFLCLFTWPYLYSQTIKMATMLVLKGKNYVAHYLSTQRWLTQYHLRVIPSVKKHPHNKAALHTRLGWLPPSLPTSYQNLL